MPLTFQAAKFIESQKQKEPVTLSEGALSPLEEFFRPFPAQRAVISTRGIGLTITPSSDFT